MLPLIDDTVKTPATNVLGIHQDSDHGNLLEYCAAEADTELRMGRVGGEAEDVVTWHLRVCGGDTPGAQWHGGVRGGAGEEVPAHQGGGGQGTPH